MTIPLRPSPYLQPADLLLNHLVDFVKRLLTTPHARAYRLGRQRAAVVALSHT